MSEILRYKSRHFTRSTIEDTDPVPVHKGYGKDEGPKCHLYCKRLREHSSSRDVTSGKHQ